MIRKTVFRGTLFGVFAIITLMLASLAGRVGFAWGNKPTLPFGDVALTRGDLTIHHYRRGPCGPHYAVGFCGFQLQDYNSALLLMEDRSLQSGFWSASNVQHFYMCLPLWMPLMILGAWPFLASVRGPLRRHRRRRKGLCAKCGYNLTGNVSGVCPECGEPAAGMIHRQARSPAWVAWLAAFVCFYLLLCIGYLLAVPLCLSFCGRYPSLGVRIAIYIACMLVNAAWSYAVSRSLYRTLRWTTFADGIPRCVSCGYNLTGNVTGICPECGRPTADRSSSDSD